MGWTGVSPSEPQCPLSAEEGYRAAGTEGAGVSGMRAFQCIPDLPSLTGSAL